MSHTTDTPNNYYWVGWVQPTADYRPLTYPPNQAILGWWCTGKLLSDHVYDGATLAALVKASDEATAKTAVLNDWPEAKDWRFCDGMKSLPVLGSRYPLAAWMQERFRLTRTRLSN